ncbi:MAG: hypothetical protein Q4F95_15260 [Oscillospiraceae bacterium]|nr:hypothetical protein [Oscillospiraceae bacterium]
MKQLSYREKIILLVFVTLMVIIVFVAWPIKGIKANTKNHKQQQKDIKVVYDENNRLIDQIPDIEKNIMTVYDSSKGYSEKFTVHRKNFEIDKYIQEVLNQPELNNGTKNNIEVYGQFIEDEAVAGELGFYYYTPNVVTYPILQAADTNGDMLVKTDKALATKLANALAMCLLEPQQIEKHTATVTMRFTKESLMTFQDKIKELDTGIRISSVAIDDYSFGKNNPDPNEVGYSQGTIKFNFYTMQQIQKPVFSDAK